MAQLLDFPINKQQRSVGQAKGHVVQNKLQYVMLFFLKLDLEKVHGQKRPTMSYVTNVRGEDSFVICDGV